MAPCSDFRSSMASFANYWNQNTSRPTRHVSTHRVVHMLQQNGSFLPSSHELKQSIRSDCCSLWAKKHKKLNKQQKKREHIRRVTCVHIASTQACTCDYVYVSTGLQFHTKLSTVSDSAETGLFLPWLANFVILCWGKKHSGSKVIKDAFVSCKYGPVLLWLCFTFPCPHHFPSSPSASLCSSAKLHWAVLDRLLLKISKWLSEGLPSCCMLMSSALHWRINTKNQVWNHSQFAA